ncbi:MAG TPA: hypothetical protein VK527_11530 [Candidatus Limnocylindrales bacterium]|nr:hypothetical protein [Candidatus Limnocylindrales bacterium]
MNRLPVWIACIGMALALTAPAPKADAADVSINLRVGDPYRGPSLVFRSEPRVVVVPGTRVYYVQDYDYDVYRYGSYWYYNYDGGWYRARRYSGPYAYIGVQSVPRSVAYVPVKYRRHWREPGSRGNAYGRSKAVPVRGNDRAYDRPNDRGKGRGNDDEGKGHGQGKGHGH